MPFAMMNAHYQGHAAVNLCRPTCRLYSVDGSYCGGEGLVTEKYKADFLLVCTQEATICKDCFSVKGPKYYRIRHFSKVEEADASYLLSVEWDKSYYGRVYVGMNPESR